MKSILTALALMLYLGSLQAQDFSRHYESARTAYDDGKHEDAFIHLKNALQDNPDHLPSTLLMGNVYFDTGNMQAAEQLFNEALELGADLNLVLPLLGSSLILQNKVDALIAFEDRYDTLNRRGKFEWHLLRGQAYILQQRPEQADAQLNQAKALFPNEIRAINATATFYLQHGRYTEAEALVSQALEQEPENEKTWQLKGDIALKQGQFDQALGAFQKAYSIDAEDMLILKGLTHSHFSLENYEQAHKFNQQLLELNPMEPTANILKSWILGYQGNPAAAKDLLMNLSQNLAELDPEGILYKGSNSYVHGLSEYMQGNMDSAQRILLKHVQTRADDTKALRLLTETYIKDGNTDRAIVVLEKHQSQVNNDLDLGLLLVNLHFSQENLFRAEKVLEALRGRFANSLSVKYTEADLLARQGKFAAALDIIRQIETNTEQLRFQLLKAKLLLRTGNEEQADSLITELLEKYPENPEALNLSSTLLIARGQFEQADETIQKVLAGNESNQSANFNLALLQEARQDYSQARETLKAMLKQRPAHVPALLKLADIEVKTGNQDAATEQLQKVLAYAPQNKQAQEKILNIMLQRRMWKEALSIVDGLRKKERFNPQFIGLQARLYIETNNLEAAKANLDVLFSLWSDNAGKLLELATLQKQAEDVVGARKSLQKAEQLQPRNSAVLVALTRLEIGSDNLSAAKALVNRLAKTDIQPSQLSLIQGELASANKNWANAAKAFEQAINEDNSNLAAIVGFYQMTLQGHQATQFHSILEPIVEKTETPAWIRKLLADSYLISNDNANARKHYEALLSTAQFNDNPAVLNNLANLYAASDLDKALQTAEKALSIAGKSNHALLDTLGWIHAQKGSYESALSPLREAYVLNSSDPEIRYHLGYVLAKLDRVEEARNQLRAATKNSNHPVYKEASLLLESLEK
ncbi:XrtA/PEP-CTERM system TPR-repeat protein PrsT [Lacimicrobium alkaliphilum]|uniref:PEP-CTERM system TPR-repeat protein PrsT n=1 Tax=Lacimicrobium alkaliphilum TaxID=1526571 RepID=A0ABQ1RGD5_9ALTE|nr:XrtA/PEP-CTERM system TPR-repeat protein PrsT [Lacimicrobium alkaliphilum]GGD69514.1 hypothetical protein GCM10011357_25710 [Lacimicrobium alkaliphilum]